jgi:DNA-binding CsgD family transcriptional regulator
MEFRCREKMFESLEVISTVHFTGREVDVIACLINGRSARGTAAVLSISPKTVETHIRSIMQKLHCNSKEQIIDFVEKSGKKKLIQEYYHEITLASDFGKILREVAFSKVRLKKIQLICRDSAPEKKSCYALV